MPPAALVPGTSYIRHDLDSNSISRTSPFNSFNPRDYRATFGYYMGAYSPDSATNRYYNDADLIANGLPLPA